MDFTLSAHAEERRTLRNVSLETIAEVFSNPDSTGINPRGNGLIYKRSLHLRGLFREIKLVIDDTVEPNRIITVYVDNE